MAGAVAGETPVSDGGQIGLTVVMPAYNEAALIEAAVREVSESVLSVAPSSRLVVVDDGSRDDTGAILDRLAATDVRLTVIHQPNGGHGRALLRGLQESRTEWTLLLDSDRQIPLDAFVTAWHARLGKQAVLGIREHRTDPLVRKLLTGVLQMALGVLLGVRLTDPNVPFKLIRRDLLEAVRPLINDDTLIPSVFIAAYAARYRMAVTFVPLRYRQRQAGQGSLRRWKLLRFAARAMLQLVALSLALRRRGPAGLAASRVIDRAA